MATILFRDGPREVVDHLADLMSPLETYRMTYDDAVKLVNENLLTDRLLKAQNDLIKEHFEQFKVRP